MDFIVEDVCSLKKLEKYSDVPLFLGIIPSNDLYHPRLNSVVALYFAFKGVEDTYMVPINHSECTNLELEEVLNTVNKFKHIFTLSKKESLYYLGKNNTIDISLIAILLKGEKLEIKTPAPTIDMFYRIHSDYFSINSIIPIVKLHQKWDHIYKAVRRHVITTIPPYFEFYNTKASKVYYALEYTGLKVSDKFADYYQDLDTKYNISRGKAFTWYNMNTLTTRPSNTYNRVNFAALNKESGVRGEILPSNDYLVEFDYDGSHIRLLCYLMGYELGEESAHTQLAKLYFPNQEITQDLYEQSKKITFAAFYGTIPKKYETLEIFVKLKNYISQLEFNYKKLGFIKDPYTGRPIQVDTEDVSPTKLLNYTIQSFEASRNVEVLEGVIKYLINKKSKIVLYTYDSFLIDFSKEDGKESLSEIQNLLSQQGKYPVKFKYGKNLNL
jgi:hypothetical protein